MYKKENNAKTKLSNVNQFQCYFKLAPNSWSIVYNEVIIAYWFVQGYYKRRNFLSMSAQFKTSY